MPPNLPVCDQSVVDNDQTIDTPASAHSGGRGRDYELWLRAGAVDVRESVVREDDSFERIPDAGIADSTY